MSVGVGLGRSLLKKKNHVIFLFLKIFKTYLPIWIDEVKPGDSIPNKLMIKESFLSFLVKNEKSLFLFFGLIPQ